MLIQVPNCQLLWRKLRSNEEQMLRIKIRNSIIHTRQELLKGAQKFCTVARYLLGTGSSLSDSSLSDNSRFRRVLDFPPGMWWMWCTADVSINPPEFTTGTPGVTMVAAGTTGDVVATPGYVWVWWRTGAAITLERKDKSSHILTFGRHSSEIIFG